MNGLTWIGILLCLSQSAMLSGLNLGLFSLSKLELQVEAKCGNRRAQRVLAVREDVHFALMTILWAKTWGSTCCWPCCPVLRSAV